MRRPSHTLLSVSLSLALAACGKRQATPSTKQAVDAPPSVDGFIAELTEISLTHAELAKGTSPDRIMLAVMVDDEGKVSGLERPTLAAHCNMTATSEAGARALTLRGPLVADPSTSVEVRVVDTGDHESARLVDPKTDESRQQLDSQGKVRIRVSRDPKAPASEPGRLRVASLWALIGENVHVAYRPVEFEAAVLGTHLVRSTIPALFQAGDGHWVLLKTTQPDELYFAFDATTGDAEFFPKAPNQPTAAGRALFTAL